MIKIKKHREIFNRKIQAEKLEVLKADFSPDQIRGPLLLLIKEFKNLILRFRIAA